MLRVRTLCWSVLLLFFTSGPLFGQEAPSYSKQVKPFFARYCLECHNAADAKSDLTLETFEGLQRGGRRGAAVVPGKPDESRLVLLPERKLKPAMPPQKARQPKPEEVAILRAWVIAGAKNDSIRASIVIPDIKPRIARPAPITALAYRPDGKLLAVAQHRQVILLDPSSGDVQGKLEVPGGKVTALAYSPDGRQLAAAGSAPGSGASVYLCRLDGDPSGKMPLKILTGHQDMILDMTFSPDATKLATAGYDRLIKLWDTTTGIELQTLRDHSDAVYGVVFSPEGRLVASAGADRAVKVWDVAKGTRLFTLGEATDWVYAVAWHPGGRRLAAAGVDRSIRVWEVSPAGGRLVQSVFAHKGPITRLVFAADGKTLYSLGEDSTAKSWNTATMAEGKVYDRETELALALAVRHDDHQLALGRYDGAVVLLDAATGRIQAKPLPVKPKPPELTKVSPTSGQRGRTIRLTFEGKHLGGSVELVSTLAGVTAKFLPATRAGNSIQADVTYPANSPAGMHKLGLKTAAGQTAQIPFLVDLYPLTQEAEPNDSPTGGQPITLPATLAGTISRAGDVDFYRFEAKAGQQVGVQALTAALGSKLAPVLELIDGRGRLVAESSNGTLGHTCQQAGMYALGIRDQEYRGGADWRYRLHIGDIPVVTAVFPLGLERGTKANIHVQGVHLGNVSSVPVEAPAGAPVGSWLRVPVAAPGGAPLGDARVVVGEFPEVVNPGSISGSVQLSPLPVPGTANGRIERAGETQSWRFAARKGRRLILEVNARRLGSPLDSVLEILDAHGVPVPRAKLRSVAQTYTTFKDHDSSQPNIRIENWNELAVNDYLWVGHELIRVQALPKTPDDDCEFFASGKVRIGYLDTTPGQLSQGSPMYKVTIHPADTPFSPNGFPVITLDYRNDDGGPGYGKDSRLFFDPPADGEYQARIGDARGQAGSNYAYRLTVRPPRPSFDVSFSPTAPSVWKGSGVPVAVSVRRHDGFDGPIEVHLENLPPGFSAPVTSVPAGEESTAFALSAEASAAKPTQSSPLKLLARARIDGKEVVREVAGGVPNLLEAGLIAATTEQSEVTVTPGGQVRLTARIERRQGFKARVPLEVRGLPHGVRVLDIGLNGILITEQETARTFAIFAEPWVQPTTHPFVVLAQDEAKGTEYAARSVLLRVAQQQK